MNGTRIVMPQSLQQEYLQCLHMGHLGISKCRARAKAAIFWESTCCMCGLLLIFYMGETLTRHAI